MDAIVFGMKRAHWVVHHRLVAKVVAPFGLTPSRFDVLYLLMRHRASTQKELRGLLSVARSTLSRMLGALERLGFVKRDSARLGRTREVSLTNAGEDAVRRALELGRGGRVIRRVLSEGMDFSQRCVLESVLMRVRQAFWQATPILYSWHPDD